MSLNHTKSSAQKSPSEYSTESISKVLLDEISSAIKKIDGYGSVEIYIQDSIVTQITTRNIKKTHGFARKPHVT